MTMSRMQQHATVDAYFAAQPQEIQNKLQELRQIIKKAAPAAEECISYGMPTFKYKGKPLVYFAAFKNHFGFFPQPKAIEVFKDQLTGYETSKGTIRLPQDKALPKKLLADIVKFKLKENEEKAKLKKEKASQ